MKRVSLVLMFFLTLTSFVYLNAQWARSYGGSGLDTAYSIQQTSDGGYIIAGYTDSFGAGGRDFWVLKLSSTGAIDWQRTYGGSLGDYAFSIQQTGDGGYIVAGWTDSFGAGNYDIWVLKLSSIGTIDWQRTYGGSLNDTTYSIQQTSDGGYIVGGIKYAAFWVLKLSSIGDVEWQRTYGRESYDEAYSIQQTSDGGYIIAGRTELMGAGRSMDAWVLKLSSIGDVEWQRAYGGSGDEAARSIQETSDGGYFVAGYVQLFGSGSFDALVLKLSATGDVEWQCIYGEEVGSDSPYSSQQTSDGGYIIAGRSGPDVWVLKLRSTGGIDWQRTYDGLYAHSIQLTSDGGYIVAGDTDSFGAGGSDFLLLKLFSDGDIDPSCELVGSSNATIIYTLISLLDTSITPQDTDVIPLDTICSTQDTYAAANLICEAQEYTLTISTSTGGTTDPSPGSYTYIFRTKVIIEAKSDSGYEFSEWSGDASGTDNPITVTIGPDKSITANFTKEEEEKKGRCFIATAAYGSPLHPHLDILRDFRDTYLMPSRFGHKLVELYYKYSPLFADLIAKQKALKFAVRISLLPIIAFSYSMVHFGLIMTAAMLAFIFALPIFLILFFRRRIEASGSQRPKSFGFPRVKKTAELKEHLP